MAKKTEPATEAPEAAKGGKKKLLVVVLAVALLAGGGWFLLGRGESAEAAEPEPGPVLPLDSITLNLAEGRYLKLGLALQLTVEGAGGHGGGSPDGSKALDLAISLLSNRDAAELSSNTARAKLKAELTEQVEHAYEGDVMGLYFTEFVMQ